MKRLSEEIDLNIDRTYDDPRFITDSAKREEITRFEHKFPGAVVLNDKYDSEKDLDSDWTKYNLLPYSLKILSNERCLKYYGMKNEDLYYKLKKKFLDQNIENTEPEQKEYIPGSNMNEVTNLDVLSMANKEARDYMEKGGHELIPQDIKNLDDLNSFWYRFNDQCDEHKAIANDKSVHLYGIQVPEMYQKLLHKFLHNDISYKDNFDILKNPEVGSVFVGTEAYDSIMDTEDILESSIYLDSLNRKEKESGLDIIESSIRDSIIENNVSILEDKEDYVKGASFLTPNEILSAIGEENIVDKKWFDNYRAKFVGLKPEYKDFYSVRDRSIYEAYKEKDDKKMISFGWNPMLEYTKENLFLSSKRANNEVRSNMNFSFVDLTKTKETNKDTFPTGISVFFIKESDPDINHFKNPVYSMLFSFNPLNKNDFYSIDLAGIHSNLSYDFFVGKFYKKPLITVFFLPLDKDFYNECIDHINDIVLNYHSQDSELKSAIMGLGKDKIEIANKRLFTSVLINTLLGSVKSNDNILHFTDKNEIIYILFNRVPYIYNDIIKSYSKINIFDEYRNLTESTFLDNIVESYKPYIKKRDTKVNTFKKLRNFISNTI